MKYGITILTLLLLFASCEEKIEQDLDFEADNLIVVEGLLTTELKRHQVIITKPYAKQNQTPEPVSGAFVAIANSDEDIFLLTEEPAGSGIYLTPPLRAVTGKFYLLVIRYNGKEYQAFDTPPGGQFLDNVLLDTIQEDGINKYSLLYRESGSIPNYVSHDIDWSTTPYCNANESCQGKVVFYDLKNIDVQEIFAPEKEKFYFPEGTIIHRKKYSISEKYTEFLRSLLSETEWRGGFFDVTRDDIPTNFTEGAIGFFATATVDQDSIIIKN